MADMSADALTIGSIYNEFGEYYDSSRKEDSGRFTNEYIDLPTLTSLIDDDLSGKHVLDAGCGSGIVSELLARRGASVKSVDVSSKMIEIARKRKPSELDIAYSVGDIEHLEFSENLFDLVVCNYVLENVSAIASVFAEFKRIMKANARCVFSISHPLRALTEKQEGVGQEVWVLKDYFDQSMRQSDFGGGMVVPKYRRTISNYVDAAHESGLLVRRVADPPEFQIEDQKPAFCKVLGQRHGLLVTRLRFPPTAMNEHNWLRKDHTAGHVQGGVLCFTRSVIHLLNQEFSHRCKLVRIVTTGPIWSPIAVTMQAKCGQHPQPGKSSHKAALIRAFQDRNGTVKMGLFPKSGKFATVE